jgi:hypothetical protein
MDFADKAGLTARPTSITSTNLRQGMRPSARCGVMELTPGLNKEFDA